jgi:hypothetical protein
MSADLVIEGRDVAFPNLTLRQDEQDLVLDVKLETVRHDEMRFTESTMPRFC